MNPEILYKLLGKKIRDKREKSGLSQSKLAGKLKMSRVSVVNIEAGRQRPPLHLIWKIAEIFETELSLLLPSQSDFLEQLEPIILDDETIHKIEEATIDDPKARAMMMRFISKVKSQGDK